MVLYPVSNHSRRTGSPRLSEKLATPETDVPMRRLRCMMAFVSAQWVGINVTVLA